MSQSKFRFGKQVWKLRELAAAGKPDFRLGAGEALPHERKSVRVAPSRNNKPLTSFWSFWVQGNEIYVSARSVSGVHKLSFHSSGRWYSTLGSDSVKLAPPWPLPGGKWLHALEVRFLIDDGALPPRDEQPFRESDPGWTVALPPDEFLTVQLLMGSEGTTHDLPLPANWDWPKLLKIKRRDGRCAVVVFAHFPITEVLARKMHALHSFRIQTSKPPNPKATSLELHELAVTKTNVITVVPLGPESFDIGPAPPGSKRLRWRKLK